MENKQTAVEWLIEQLRSLSHSLEAHLGTGDIRVTQGMIDEFEEQAKQMEKEQTEISDEKIEKAAYEWCKGIDEDGYVRTGDDFDISELPAFIAACKWYREQLKQKL